MAILVRRADATDGLPAARVLVRSRLHAVPSIPPPVHDARDIETWFTTVVLPEREVWVAETDSGTLVGVMVLRGPSVEQLYLEPGWTGQGIGTRLIDQAKTCSPDGLDLWAFVSNVGARRFYERHGFVAVEVTDGSGNEERAPDVRYVWRPQASAPRTA